MKKTIKLSLSARAIANLKTKARLNGYMWGEDPNISALIEAYAMGKLDEGISDLIAQAQFSLKELARAFDKDDPDYIE